jgi:hypothetical protein
MLSAKHLWLDSGRLSGTRKFSQSFLVYVDFSPVSAVYFAPVFAVILVVIENIAHGPNRLVLVDDL